MRHATVGTRANVTLGGAVVPVDSLEPRRASIRATIRSGRLPDGPDEIALGRVTRRQVHARPGDSVRVVGQSGVAKTMRIVGEVVLPPRLDLSVAQRLGQGGLLTPAGLHALAPGVAPSFVLVDLVTHPPPTATLTAR